MLSCADLFRMGTSFVPEKNNNQEDLKENPQKKLNTNVVQLETEDFKNKIFQSLNRGEIYSKLSDNLLEMSLEINESLGENLLDDEARIRIDGFAPNEQKDKDGILIFTKKDKERDQRKIKELEMDFSEKYFSEKGIMKKDFISDYKLHNQDDKKVKEKMIQVFKNERKLERNALLEMALTSVFHKILKDRFLVVRSHPHDDFLNGADNVIVDKRTGDVVCAFDEVHDTKEGNRLNDKKEKIKKKAREGGAEIKYGITYENGKLVKKKIQHVPTFYLGVDPKEFNTLLSNMNYDLSQAPDITELRIFDMLIDSLEKQIDMLEKEVAFSQNDRSERAKNKKKVENKLRGFKSSLKVMKDLRAKF